MVRSPVLLMFVLTVASGGSPGEHSRNESTQRADTVRIEVGSPLVNGTYYPAHVGHNTTISLQGGNEDTTASWINTLVIGDSAGIPVHRWHTGGTSRNPAGQTVRFDIWQTFNARTLELYGYHRVSSAGAETRLAINGPRVRGTQKPPNGPVTNLDFTLPRAGYPSGAADLVPPAVGLREGLVIIMPVWQVPSQNVVDQIWRVVRRTTIPFDGRIVPSWEMTIMSAGGVQTGTIWIVDESPYMVRWDVMNPQGQVGTRMIGRNIPR